ncbi:MAG: cytochrome c maturation protein CcmE [Hyphomicrobiaceae bacterium]|nr:cytochrome c maturation protein CcmE [Hyphomicrobiaceae bacterium]MCC0025292.1 cytochrome c maturation protein CcmE [Hyphomicrobiaceae bacterium]
MTRKQKRLALILGLLLVLGLATALILNALRNEIVFFFSPSELIERGDIAGQSIRVGGLVEDGTWVKNGQDNTFTITDGDKELKIAFVGILPDLFREGQGVIAEGKLGSDGTFVATNVLAKHDENYIPKEIEQTLKDQGHWEGQ